MIQGWELFVLMKLLSQFWASLLREGNPDDMDNIAPAMLRNSMMVFRLGPSKQKQNDAKQVSKSIKGIF
jgi:hypothetical protein